MNHESHFLYMQKIATTSTPRIKITEIIHFYLLRTFQDKKNKLESPKEICIIQSSTYRIFVR